MLMKLMIPKGKSLYDDAPFDVRRRLFETFKRFKVIDSREIVGESLLRLERVCRKTKRHQQKPPTPTDQQSRTLFEMLRYYKSLK
jgi:hypothetical protein